MFYTHGLQFYWLLVFFFPPSEIVHQTVVNISMSSQEEVLIQRKHFSQLLQGLEIEIDIKVSESLEEIKGINKRRLGEA